MVRTFFLLFLCLALFMVWQLPALKFLLQNPRPVMALQMPVDGVGTRQVANTWLAPRPGGRQHQGVDIFANRGTLVRAATDALVLAKTQNSLGGTVVWLLAPGGERHYYAHLDRIASTLAVGQVIRCGTVIGTVGNTGNARTTPPHLHFGVYTRVIGGAVNPWPRLKKPRLGQISSCSGL